MSNERKNQPNIRNNSGNNPPITGRGTTKINKNFFNDTAGKIIKRVDTGKDSNKKD
ncbi:hypothetical protein [Priestia megaterium]|uniref:hypothetical protein n=1 Tax=Priestia megaterium TaxID=1404 RepID=UPI001596E0EB|nr:hypothetical protein [Priestia megaterium]